MPRILCVKTGLSRVTPGGPAISTTVDDRLSMCQEKEKNGGFYVMLMPPLVGGARSLPLAGRGLHRNK